MTTKLTTITVMNQALRVEYSGLGIATVVHSVQGIEDIESFFTPTVFNEIYEKTASESLHEHFHEQYFMEEAKGDEVSRGN